MGCWNETCMLSSLPIRYGDPVVVYFLAPFYSESICHNIYSCCDQYSPVGFALSGIYDDYGTIEKICDNEAASWTYRLLDHLQKTGAIKLSEEADQKTAKLSNLSHYTKAAERGWLITSSIKNKKPLSLIFMHEDLYKNILAEGVKRICYNSDKSFYEICITMADKYTAEKLDIERKKENNYAGILSLNLRDDLGFTRHFTEYHRNRKVTDFLLKSLTDKTKDLRNLMVEVMVFETYMNLARMMWRMTPGKGSQSVEFAIPKIIADYTYSQIKHELQNCEKEGVSGCDPLRETIFNFN